MKKLLLFSLFVCCAMLQIQAQCDCTDCPNSLYEPDDISEVMTITSQIEITTTGADNLAANPLQEACIQVSHNWLGDVAISLESPSGLHYAVVGDDNNVDDGDCGDVANNMNICLVQGNTSPLTNGESYAALCGSEPDCLTGDWTLVCDSAANDFVNGAIAAPNCDLNDFNQAGNTVSGTWTLRVQCVCGIEPGVLEDWSLSFADNSVVDCDDNTPTPCELSFEEAVQINETGTICLPAAFDFENLCPDQEENVSIASDGECLTFTGTQVGQDVFCFAVDINGEICNVNITIFVTPAPTPLFAGDMNGDGLATATDFLYLGLGYGAMGPARDNANDDWSAQFCEDWPQQTLMTQTNFKHMDANGDGIINMDDAATLNQNWGLSHEVDNVNTPPLIEPVFMLLDLEDQSVTAGDFVSIPVRMAMFNTTTVRSLAFKVHIDPTIFHTDNVDFIPMNSWLGESNELIEFHTTVGEIFHVALSRTDNNDQFGDGIIGMLVLHAREDLTETTASGLGLEIDMVLNSQEFAFAATADGATVEVLAVNDVTNAWANAVQIFPNPAQTEVFVSHLNTNLNSLTLYDASGRILQQITPTGTQTRINTVALDDGVYLLQLQSEAGIAVRKVVVMQ